MECPVPEGLGTTQPGQCGGSSPEAMAWPGLVPSHPPSALYPLLLAPPLLSTLLLRKTKEHVVVWPCLLSAGSPRPHSDPLSLELCLHVGCRVVLRRHSSYTIWPMVFKAGFFRPKRLICLPSLDPLSPDTHGGIQRCPNRQARGLMGFLEILFIYS